MDGTGLDGWLDNDDYDGDDDDDDDGKSTRKG